MSGEGPTAASGRLHYPISDTECVCVCGWKPDPAPFHFQQIMRLEEHLLESGAYR